MSSIQRQRTYYNSSGKTGVQSRKRKHRQNTCAASCLSFPCIQRTRRTWYLLYYILFQNRSAKGCARLSLSQSPIPSFETASRFTDEKDDEFQNP